MKLPPPPRHRRKRFPWPVAGLLLLFAAVLHAQDDETLPEWIGEPNSPGEQMTHTVTPGLTDRAVPVLSPPDQPESDYQPLYRITRPYYDTLFATPAPSFVP